MIPPQWMDEAWERLEGQVVHTPLTYDPETGLYLKWENRQLTGSFKLRGALNKVLSLQPWERERGLVTASAGNHGQGVALAAARCGARVTVFASEQAPAVKLEAMRALGAEVRLVPGLYAEAESAGLAFARQTERTWISPYNDGQVIAGQATLGMEIEHQLDQAGAAGSSWTAVIPVGGGGLAAGVGLALRRSDRPWRLIGVQPENSAYFYQLYYHGTQQGVSEAATLADGLEGAVEAGSLTIPLVRSLLDGIVLVSEDQIARGIAIAFHRHAEKIEGAAAAAFAAALSGKITERPAVVLLTGGNIQPELHRQLCERCKTDTW